MIPMLVIVGILTIAQSFVAGISFAMLTMWVSRALFVGRLFGMKSKLSATITLELFALGFFVILPLAFGGGFSLLKTLAWLFMSLIFVIINVYDDVVNIYIEKDI